MSARRLLLTTAMSRRRSGESAVRGKSSACILHAWMNGERLGRLEQSAARGLSFFYSPEWLHSAQCRPLSLSLPLRAAGDPWRGAVVQNYFDNLLPDTLRQRQQMRLQFSARSTEAFDLLSAVGRDCRGALQLTTDDVPPENRLDQAMPLTEVEIEQMLDSLDRHAPLAGCHPLGAPCALGGAHNKTALLLHDQRWHLPAADGVSTHILKLACVRHSDSGFMLASSLENAWLCQRVATALGVPVPNCELLHFGAHKALAIARVDRRVQVDAGKIICLPQEDMCQAFGLSPGEKYQINGGPDLVSMSRLLLGSQQAVADRLALLRTQLVFWMLCAFDGHAKNFSLAHRAGGGFHLAAPLGVLSTYPLLGYSQGKLSPDKARMALGVRHQQVPELWHSLRVEHWLDLARRCAIPEQQMRQQIAELIALALPVSASLRKRLPAGFPVAVSEPILQGVVHAAQRLKSVA